MHWVEQLVLVLGLSADGFAAAVCMGTSDRDGRYMPLAALCLTAAHGLMLAAGWLLGGAGRRFIGDAASFLGAAVLLWFGTEAVFSAGRDEKCDMLSLRRITMMSLAAGVDALTVGTSFALSGVGILLPLGMTVGLMGLLSVAGVLWGKHIGQTWQRRAQKTGGLILCAIGVRMLLG